jgi:glutaredoxin
MFCRRTEEFLREKGVGFTTRNVVEDDEAFAELERMGTMSTPVTVIDREDIVVGFDRQQLKRSLGLERSPMTEGEEQVSHKKAVEGEEGAEDAPKLWVFGIPFRTLLSREIRRFMRVWTQTLLAPLLTSALYVVVFGYGLGSRIREVEGIPYLEFILPGLILLSVITGSYGNTSSSLFDAKRERYIDDVLISPITPLQMSLAYVLGGPCGACSWARARSFWRYRSPACRRSVPCCS